MAEVARPRRRGGGPRSAEGKRRAAQNARRHGLTAARLGDPGVAALLAELAGPMPDPAGSDALPGLAEAEVLRRRTRRHQRAIEADIDAAIATGALPDPSLWRALRLACRYRAEAEAAWRKALRRVIAEMQDADAA